ncbi:MAG: hypothetical protein Kow0056_13240 [Coriobacteriia bacterium]
MRNRSLRYFVFGVVVGAAAGVVAGVLMAPESGERTRRAIAEKAQDLARMARVVAERAEQAAEVLGQRVDHYLGRDEEVAWRKIREIREGVQRYTQAQHG